MAELAAAGVTAEDHGVGPAAPAKGDEGGGFVVGDAAANKLEQSGFAHAGVFQIGERRAGENRQVRGAAVSVFEDDFVGKAGEAHGDSFAAPGAELSKLRKLHNGGAGTAGTKKLGDRFTNVEVLFAIAFEAKEGEAIVVGEARLARLSDLAYFGVGDVHAAKRLNGGEIHAGLIEEAGVERLEALAGSEGEQRAAE